MEKAVTVGDSTDRYIDNHAFIYIFIFFLFPLLLLSFLFFTLLLHY